MTVENLRGFSSQVRPPIRWSNPTSMIGRLHSHYPLAIKCGNEKSFICRICFFLKFPFTQDMWLPEGNPTIFKWFSTSNSPIDLFHLPAISEFRGLVAQLRKMCSLDHIILLLHALAKLLVRPPKAYWIHLEQRLGTEVGDDWARLAVDGTKNVFLKMKNDWLVVWNILYFSIYWE